MIYGAKQRQKLIRVGDEKQVGLGGARCLNNGRRRSPATCAALPLA